jgi:hypothetical protein
MANAGIAGFVVAFGAKGINAMSDRRNVLANSER